MWGVQYKCMGGTPCVWGVQYKCKGGAVCVWGVQSSEGALTIVHFWRRTCAMIGQYIIYAQVHSCQRTSSVHSIIYNMLCVCVPSRWPRPEKGSSKG